MKYFSKSRITILLNIIFLINIFAATANNLSVESLKTEYHTNPIGITQQNPRFFWKLKSGEQNTMQTGYHIQASLSPDFEKTDHIVWDSDFVNSEESIHIPYQGDELQSGKRYYWRVRVKDNHNNTSGWSETAYWEMGLLNDSDWKAQWIEVPWEESKKMSPPAPMLRHNFTLRDEVASARAYASCFGLYEMEINGQKVGDQLFTPGWTNYKERVQYQTYDITDLLEKGDNAVGVTLGDGWYRGFIGWGHQRNYYGETLAFISQIHVTYKDGSTDIIITDNDWCAATGPIIKSDIYNGEYYDARLEKEGWSMASYDYSDWESVQTKKIDHINLIAPQGPPVKKIQELKPVNVLFTPEGDTVLDMGQNFVGWMKIKVKGPKGKKITLRHAETLDKHGNFYTENLRSADQENVYILKGEGTEIWEPHFTFQGFRYVAVHGYPGNINAPDAFTGIVIHSEMEPTGHFDCSHPLLNRLQHNIVWGQKSNFLDIPTDCPQRDERLGWTGDILVFASTANIYMNTASFLSNWLSDLKSEQFENGAVPHVIPNVLGDNAGGSSGWADASTVVPWSVYKSFGDKHILEQQYESMKKWVGYMKERAASQGDPHIWTGDFHFGDWLSFSTISRANYPGAHTHTDLIATAYFAHSTRIALKTATILGKEKDILYFSKLFSKVKTAFQNEFMTPNGRLSSDTQTAYLLALQFDLLPEEFRQNAAEYLVRDVRHHGHLTTGFLGTPHLNHVLSEFGYTEEAYNLLMREQYPSWLYPVTMGATTIWERWDGIKTDSTFQSKGMNSFNHYAYGAIGEWLFKEVAGIQNSLPGYKNIVIHPNPGGNLSHARAFQNTLYGKVSSEWYFSENNFVLTVKIPANTKAEIILPHAEEKNIKMDGMLLPEKKQVSDAGKNIRVEIGAGEYTFSYPATAFPEYALPDPAEQTKITYNENILLADLLAHEAAREILFKEMPTLMHSPWLSQVMGFTIENAMVALPKALKLSDKKINKINKQLKKVF